MISFGAAGFVDYPVVFCLAAPGVVMSSAGAALATRLSPLHLKLTFGAVLCALCPLVVWDCFKRGEPPSPGPAAVVPVGGTAAEAPLGLEWLGLQAAALGTMCQESPAVAAGHMACGCVYGLSVGMLGVGGTPIVVAYLSLCTDKTQKAVCTAPTELRTIPAHSPILPPASFLRRPTPSPPIPAAASNQRRHRGCPSPGGRHRIVSGLSVLRRGGPHPPQARQRGGPTTCSHRRDCHFTDTPCLSLLKHLEKIQGGAIKCAIK